MQMFHFDVLFQGEEGICQYIYHWADQHNKDSLNRLEGLRNNETITQGTITALNSKENELSLQILTKLIPNKITSTCII